MVLIGSLYILVNIHALHMLTSLVQSVTYMYYADVVLSSANPRCFSWTSGVLSHLHRHFLSYHAAQARVVNYSTEQTGKTKFKCVEQRVKSGWIIMCWLVTLSWIHINKYQCRQTICIVRVAQWVGVAAGDLFALPLVQKQILAVTQLWHSCLQLSGHAWQMWTKEVLTPCLNYITC